MYDLTKATRAATMAGHDLSKAAGRPGGTKAPVAFGRARQTPATSSERPMKGRAAKNAGKAMPTKAKGMR